MNLDGEINALFNGEPAILAGVARVDEALLAINGRLVVPADEVTNWLLDVRQALGGLYAVMTGFSVDDRIEGG